jgi:hypothetical protein
VTVLDALLDAHITEGYSEALHPRGRGGKWIPKVGDKATYFHELLGRSLDVKVHSSPDARGYMKIRLPAEHPFNGEVRRVKATGVTHPSGVPMAHKSQLGHAYDAGRAAQSERQQILAKAPSAAAELAGHKASYREARAPGAGAESLSTEAQARVARQQQLQRQLADAEKKGETAVMQGLRREIARLGRPGARLK